MEIWGFRLTPYKRSEMNCCVTGTKGSVAFLLNTGNLVTHFQYCEMLLLHPLEVPACGMIRVPTLQHGLGFPARLHLP